MLLLDKEGAVGGRPTLYIG